MSFSTQAARPKSFVKIDGTRFAKDNKPYYIIGANYWQAMNLGMENGNRSRVLKDLETLKENGFNCLRIMAASEGPLGEPYRMYPALMNAPGEYDENVFQGLDWFLDQLKNYDMTAIMTLSNFWHWSGGFAQYVHWVDDSRPIPYPETNGDAFDAYSARFYTDSSIKDTCQKYYLNHVKTVINRKNSVNGIVYKNDTTILAWELANEPQAAYVQNAHEVVFHWFDETAKFIKSLDENHLVTTGTEGKHGKDWFITMHKSDYIDFTSAHVWVENWGYYKSNDPSPENYQRAANFMLGFLQDTSDWSINILKKPILLGEFGMARDGWTEISKYDPKAPVTNRNKYFTEIANKILELEKKNASTGLMFWAFAGVARPDDEKPSWVGDPPHEVPGWYSVYDSDIETLRIFLDHSKQINNEEE
ncbi:40443_t:CDS:1 [Gigaspora margarita]|uniref:mannan endo-1,4-beta-mannosidase n=1 Tax=Gigaspora margarita TaxID=4874 RepID=A0ABN7W6C4_GIGMA|nr:40443_t:CDS:1 [Gigaspora margarita]